MQVMHTAQIQINAAAKPITDQNKRAADVQSIPEHGEQTESGSSRVNAHVTTRPVPHFKSIVQEPIQWIHVKTSTLSWSPRIA